MNSIVEIKCNLERIAKILNRIAKRDNDCTTNITFVLLTIKQNILYKRLEKLENDKIIKAEYGKDN